MKIKKIISFGLIIAVVISCKQEVITLEDPTITPPPTVTPTKGSADFTKFVAIGNSLTAGYQAGALYNEGQANSLPKILSTQFSLAQGTTLAFNQPDINSVYGYYGAAGSLILGRLILFDPDGPATAKSAGPAPVGTPGMPSPYNKGGDLPTAFAGDKTKLNNFAVPGILLGQALTPDTGNPASPFYNGLWARFASAPGVKSILQDAIAAQPTFFLFDLGNNDVLGYATGGASNSAIFTSEASFTTQYTTAITSLLGSSTTVKGVIANIPNVTTIPYFNLVAFNPVPLDAATASLLMGASGFGGYNQVMQGISATLTGAPATFGLSAAQAAPIIAQIATRLVSFTAANNNRLLIFDESLIDMKPFFDGLLAAKQITDAQRAGLEAYRQIRQATAEDLIPLPASSVIGTTVEGNPTAINGVSVPLADRFVLTKAEKEEVIARTNAFNAIIKKAADDNAARIAFADVNATFTALVVAKAGVVNGVTITPSLSPPTGVFSEDGVHPNSRGYAYMANVFIDAINTKFGATIPKASLADYKANGLPINP
jgi:lysophospholipase L1-like esterase